MIVTHMFLSRVLQMMTQSGATFETPSDDDGHISPEFDLPEVPMDEGEELAAPPSKKIKFGPVSSNSVIKSTQNDALAQEEELALRLLGRG